MEADSAALEASKHEDSGKPVVDVRFLFDLPL